MRMASWRTHNNRKRIHEVDTWDSLSPRCLSKRLSLIAKQYARCPQPPTGFFGNVTVFSA
jgi:hypothetical protein